MSERGVITSLHDLSAELHDAADDGDLVALADALELSLAQELLNRIALLERGDGLGAGRTMSLAAQRPTATKGIVSIVGDAQHRQCRRGDRRRPASRDGSRHELSREHHDSGEQGRGETNPRSLPAHSERHAGDDQRQRDARSRRREQPVRPLEIGHRRDGPAKTALGPVTQPDAAHRAARPCRPR